MREGGRKIDIAVHGPCTCLQLPLASDRLHFIFLRLNLPSSARQHRINPGDAEVFEENIHRHGIDREDR